MGKKKRNKKGSASKRLVEPSTKREYYPVVEAGIEYRIYNAESQEDAQEIYERTLKVRWAFYEQRKQRDG